jgi:hypothetical protein
MALRMDQPQGFFISVSPMANVGGMQERKKGPQNHLSAGDSSFSLNRRAFPGSPLDTSMPPSLEKVGY